MVLSSSTSSVYGAETCESVETDLTILNTKINSEYIVTKRGFSTYLQFLRYLHLRLRNQSSDYHWIDVGAGSCKQLVEYLEKPDRRFLNQKDGRYYNMGEERVRITAVTAGKNPLSRGKTISLAKKYGFKIIAKKLFEKISPRQIDKADLITDLFGALSYTGHFDVVIEAQLNTLKTGGRLLTFLPQDTHIGEYVGDSIGQVKKYLSSIKGIKVKRVESVGINMIIEVERTADALVVPKLKLTYLKNSPDGPPQRNYDTVDE